MGERSDTKAQLYNGRNFAVSSYVTLLSLDYRSPSIGPCLVVIVVLSHSVRTWNRTWRTWPGRRRDGPICKCLFVCFACHAPPGFLSFRLFNQSISFSLPIFLQSNEEVLVVEPQSIYLFHRRENELDKHMCIVETHARKHPFIDNSLRSSWWLRQMGSFGKFRFGWCYKGVIMGECWSYH